jgi:hypothetical protein
LRARITPAAPEVNAAFTAALTSEGVFFFLIGWNVDISTRIYRYLTTYAGNRPLGFSRVIS